MSSGFVIATDKRGYPEVTLFMVDRRIQKKSFWSDRLIDVFVYGDRKAAERKSSSLKFNNPRVMTMTEAEEVEECRIFSDGCDTDYDNDMGWKDNGN